MPYLSEKIPIQGTQFDRRVKLDGYQKACLKAEREHDGTSYNKLAKKYGCSKKLAIMICNPEIKEKCAEAFKQRRKDGRYYDRARSTRSVRETRQYKQQLKITGKIKQDDGQEKTITD